jgi:ABC-type uncharacterized transport system YnjBCD substrate-binding protein
MRNLLLASALLALASTPLPATPHLLDDWSGIVEAAQGQTVYLHAWGETRASTRSLVTARLLPRSYFLDACDDVRVRHEGIEEAAPVLR